MGLNINSMKFLLLARSRGVPFDSVLMIGRQRLGVSPADIRRLVELPLPTEIRAQLRRLALGPEAYAEDFFRLCGAARIQSMDKTDYEGADVMHDLNLPIPDHLANRYDLIVDGGSIEHVFNVSTALRNYMEMLKIGGHYVCNTATNNYTGHGFYQLSPEVFFAAFSSDNGFELRAAYLYEENGGNDWFRLTPPANAARRMTFQNRVPAHLLVLARKRANVPVFQHPPQQRMYDAAWAHGDPSQIDSRSGLKRIAFDWLERLPARLRWGILNTWNIRQRFRPDMFSRVSWRDFDLPID